MSATLLCFDRDLRLSDRALFAASEQGSAFVPLLVLDRRRSERIARNPRRAAYFCAAVAALDAELRLRGSQLLVRRGGLDATIRSVARATGARSVAWSKRYDPAGVREDLRLQAIVEELGLRALPVHEAIALDPERLELDAEENGFRSFNAFYRLWRAPEALRAPVDVGARFAPSVLPSEPLPRPDEFGASAWRDPVGERTARAALERFVNEHLVEYPRAIRTPAVPTSGLGLPLSYGLLSGR
ncbi:MAG: deoxyribodipyrimidine photo-lyase, partial [Candidatus Baltobacteraceae bacterium]